MNGYLIEVNVRLRIPPSKWQPNNNEDKKQQQVRKKEEK